MRAVVSSREVEDRLGRSRPTLGKLSSAGMLHRVTGGYRADDVARLERQRRKPFVPWNVGDRLLLAVPTTQEGGWDSDLSLSLDNYRDLAERGLGGVPDGLDITGWWPTREEMLHRLVGEQAIVVGIVGGYVREAGMILQGFRCLEPERYRRCAYLIEPLTDEALDAVRGVVEGAIGHTGMYVTPQWRMDGGDDHVGN